MKLLARKNVSESASTANNNRNKRCFIVKLQSVYFKDFSQCHNKRHTEIVEVVDQSLPVKMIILLLCM